jgi:hypothetical protein
MTAILKAESHRIVEVNRRFRGVYCFHHHSYAALRTSETSVYIQGGFISSLINHPITAILSELLKRR